MGTVRYFVVALLLAHVFGIAHASTTSPAQYSYKAQSGATSQIQIDLSIATSAGFIVSQWPGAEASFGNSTCTAPVTMPGDVYIIASGYCRYGGNITGVYTCPGGGQLSGISCIYPDCDSGEFRSASGTCQKDCSSKAGMSPPNSQYEVGYNTFGTFGDCQIKCNDTVSLGLNMRGDSNGQNTSTTGFYRIGGSCKYTGKSAQPVDFDSNGTGKDPAPPGKEEPSRPSDCLVKGQGFIQSSSGAVTCVKSADAPLGNRPNDQRVDSSKESGTPTPAGQPGAGAPDPTKEGYTREDTTETLGSDGSVTVDTTKTFNPGKDTNGAPKECPPGFVISNQGLCVQTETDKWSLDKYCAEKPDSAICRKVEDSVFGGSCDNGFTCTGDAATCATARATWELRCAFQGGSGGLINESNPGGSAADIEAGNAALNKSGASDFNIAEVFQANQQQWVNFSGSCPIISQTFNIAGANLTLDGSMVCDIGVFVRMLIHIFAYMTLARVFATKLV